MRLYLLIGLLHHVTAVDNGLGLTPPLGFAEYESSLHDMFLRDTCKMHINYIVCILCRWRSFNAFWGIVSQEKMETIMDAMVNRSRLVAGKPMSLLDLGYNHVGLDGGWNYCYPVKHDAKYESSEFVSILHNLAHRSGEPQFPLG